jgi:uncharacterized protein YicC (UPF0701 family)
MPLNEIPKYLDPDTRHLVDTALEEAWRELNESRRREAAPIKAKLRRTIVALASVGETDTRKLKWFAIHAWRGAMQAEQTEKRARMRAA